MLSQRPFLIFCFLLLPFFFVFCLCHCLRNYVYAWQHSTEHTVRRAPCLPSHQCVPVCVRTLLVSICVCVCVRCKQKTLVCQFELEKFCVEISQKWVVNVESAWYAVDNFQMAAICKAMWKRNGNMRNNLHSGAIFTSTAAAAPLVVVAVAVVFGFLLSSFFGISFFFFFFFFFCFGMTTLQRLLRVWAELWPGPAMFVCFGCKQLSVISDKLIWQSTGDQHAGWQHCQGAGGRGRRRRRSKSGACAKKRWKLLPLLPLTMAVAMSMRCVRGCCPLSLF